MNIDNPAMEKKQTILNFLKTQTYMIIATISTSCNPEAALVGFAQAEDLSLVFGTYTTTKKFHNLQKNPRVAIVFGTGEKGITIQYEGSAAVLKGEELEKYKKIYFTKNPEAQKYENYENEIYIKVIPSWIRYTDYNKESPDVFAVCF